MGSTQLKLVILGLLVFTVFADEISKITPKRGISVPMKRIPRRIDPILAKRSVSVPYQYDSGAWGVAILAGQQTEELYLLMDTGSFDMFVVGDQCVNCINPAPPATYIPSPSETVESCSTVCTQYSTNYCYGGSECRINVTYGDGSGAVSTIVNDLVQFPTLNSVNGYFGNVRSVQTGQSTFLVAGQAGIIGAAYVTGSSMPTNAGTLLDAMAAANNFPNIFSLCINQNNPFMSFGQDYSGSAGFQWTAVTQPAVYYTITLDDMLLSPGGSSGTSLGLSSAQLNNGGVIVDSGTSLIVLDSTIYTTLYNQLFALCGTGSNLVGICGVSQANSIFYAAYALTGDQISAYPTIQFTVSCSSGTCSALDVPPEAWIVQYTATTYTAGISENSAGSILGDVFMQNFHVVFDKTRNQVGFASQTTCNLNGKAAASTLHSAFMDLVRWFL